MGRAAIQHLQALLRTQDSKPQLSRLFEATSLPDISEHEDPESPRRSGRVSTSELEEQRQECPLSIQPVVL